MRSATYLTSLFSFLIFATLLALPTAMAEDAWYPAQIDVWSPPFNTGHQHELQQYIPPGQASGRGAYALQFRTSRTIIGWR